MTDQFSSDKISELDDDTLDSLVAGELEGPQQQLSGLFRAYGRDDWDSPAGRAVAARTDSVGFPSSGRVSRTSMVRGSRQVFRRAWQYALLATGGLTALWFAFMPGHDNDDITVQEYRTKRAQHASFVLPDGSQIILAPASELHYRGAATERAITLTGEAHFTVAHDADVSFTVQTNGVVTRVLGTTFAVRRYAEDSATQVAVLDGKVASENTYGSVVVTAGEVVRVSDSSAAVRERTDAKSVTQWVNGQLVFTNTPVPEMLATVGRWYDYEFRLADSALAHGRVTTTLLTAKPQETMEMLKNLLSVRVAIQGRVVTLYPTNRATANDSATRRKLDFRDISPRLMEAGK